ncbi:MAG: RNA polymerase sigma factor [Holophagales bacterium]|nr:RNA polymerase sigma factor [Holophagales bacterium]
MLIFAMLQWGGASQGEEGDDAFEELYRRLHGPLVGFFRRRGASYEESLDLVQETFVRALRGSGDFRGEARPSTWIHQIATNLWLNRMRDSRAAKRAGEEVPIEAGDASPVARGGVRGTSPAAGPAPGVADHLEAAERRQQLHRAMGSLPPKMRLCVELRVFQQKSFREIAVLAQTSEQSAKTLVSRAADRLRGRLAEVYPELRTEARAASGGESA